MTNPFDSAGAKAPAKPFTITEGRREVRSFVLRQGRFTPAQQRAFDDRWPRFGLDFTGEPRDLDATPGLVNRAGPRGSVPRPDWRPQTHFETRGQKLGHGVWDLLYDRT